VRQHCDQFDVAWPFHVAYLDVDTDACAHQFGACHDRRAYADRQHYARAHADGRRR
jgi:hypothetical protein